MVLNWLNVSKMALVAMGICISAVYGADKVVKSVEVPVVKTVSMLTLGNSFADNVLNQLPKIVAASGNKLKFARANLGGCSLERHWNHMVAYEKDNNDAAGKPYGGGKFSLKDMLTRQKWDVVTIQQVSYFSHDLKTYEPYASDLYAYIKKYAPQAKVYIHQVWAYRIDDPRFTTESTAGVPHTQKLMYEQVRKANHTIADKLNIGILPSGDAMYLADTDSKWGYKPDLSFNFKTAEYPALPDQTYSLHHGRFWRKQKDGSQKIFMDGHHANAAGEYLIAGVWYEILFGDSILDNSYVPKGMDEKYADFLRQTAHKTVADMKKKFK